MLRRTCREGFDAGLRIALAPPGPESKPVRREGVVRTPVAGAAGARQSECHGEDEPCNGSVRFTP